jgi:hypothetical protein
MEIDWLPIVNFVLAGISSIVIPAAAAWGVSLAQKIRLNGLKIKGDKSNLISERITQAVYATEKRANSGVLPKLEKKEFCFDLAKKLLKIDKQNVPDEILAELIETQLGLDDKEMEIATVNAPVLTRLSPPIVGTVEETSSNDRG